jgi:aspartate carbamoyltransferase regulatory subunit
VKSKIGNNGKITIECPACLGSSDRVKFYRNKKRYIKFICKYCKNSKRMNLTDYLQDEEKIQRVLIYEHQLSLGGN